MAVSPWLIGIPACSDCPGGANSESKSPTHSHTTPCKVVDPVKVGGLEPHGRQRRSRRTAESGEDPLPPHWIVPCIGNLLIRSSREFPFDPPGQTRLLRFAIGSCGKPAHLGHRLIGVSLRAELEWPGPVLQVVAVSQGARHSPALPLRMRTHEVQIVAVGDRYALQRKGLDGRCGSGNALRAAPSETLRRALGHRTPLRLGAKRLLRH